MRLGDVIRVKDLDIARNPNIDVLTSPDKVIVSVVASKNAGVDEDADADGGETGEEAK